MHNLELIEVMYGEKINNIIYQYIDIIKKIDSIEKDMENQSPHKKLLNISSILIVLSQCKNYIDPNDLEEIIYKYMQLLNQTINSLIYASPSLYGGLSTVGFSIHMISNLYPYYKKTLAKLNKLIVDMTDSCICRIKDKENLSMDDYDIISGIAGVSIYLSLFKEEYIKGCVKSINECLVEKIKEKVIYGEEVPGLYIVPENHFLDSEKEIFNKGSFNFSLSHGMCSLLVSLSLTYEAGIIVDGQKEAIEYILSLLDKFKIERNKSIFWNGMLSFEEFVDFHSELYEVEPRASWCYGVPGIARSIYLASRSINNEKMLELSKNAFKYLCESNRLEKWGLNSPTICHGFSGIVATLNLMFIDEDEDTYLDALILAIDKTIEFYNIENKYLFKNIESYEDGLKYEDNLDFLVGASGVILSLLFIKNSDVKDVFRLIGLI